jgi:hypothetical protein
MFSYWFRWLKRIFRIFSIGFIVLGVFITILSLFSYLTKPNKPSIIGYQQKYESPFKPIYDDIKASNDTPAKKEQKKKAVTDMACTLTGADCKNPCILLCTDILNL